MYNDLLKWGNQVRAPDANPFFEVILLFDAQLLAHHEKTERL
jgi:hypothetical protein